MGLSKTRSNLFQDENCEQGILDFQQLSQIKILASLQLACHAYPQQKSSEHLIWRAFVGETEIISAGEHQELTDI